MHTPLTLGLAMARRAELLEAARAHRSRATARQAAPAVLWEGLTLRLATSADRPALARLADLEQTSPPPGPILLGVLMQRPVAALSLRDGTVIADPFTPTRDLIELLRLRARQLR